MTWRSRPQPSKEDEKAPCVEMNSSHPAEKQIKSLVFNFKFSSIKLIFMPGIEKQACLLAW